MVRAPRVDAASGHVYRSTSGKPYGAISTMRQISSGPSKSRTFSVLLTLTALMVIAVSGCAGEGRVGAGEMAEPTPGASSAAATAPGSSASSAEPTASGEPIAANAPDPSASAVASAPRAASTPVVEPPGDRIYAKARHVWIQPQPRSSKGWIGYLTLGGSVRLHQGSREKSKTAGSGCDAWYRVEPDGYVCAGADATLDPADPEYVALKKDAGDSTSPWPFSYAESNGARRYAAVPSEDEQRKREWDLEKHQDRLAKAKSASTDKEVPAEVAGVDLAPAGVGAPTLFDFGPKVREGRDYVAPTSTIAFTEQFDAGGRTWLVTSDHAIVPKDRTKPYPRMEFQGVHLSETVKLPLAFFRKKDRPRFVKKGDAFEATDGSFARKSWVMLTGARETADSKTYLETRDGGFWVLEDDAAIAAENPDVPNVLDGREGRRTWVDVRVLGGTMVAYENGAPVFATLIAPGRGGMPVPGKDPISTASTPVGTFRVDGKFRWASMVSSTESTLVHSEVMYVQNFHGAHALHGAYWHDGWGELKSGGCVNLSPIDAKWLFEWSEPSMPAGWQGMRSVASFGPPTVVRVRR